MKSGLFFLLALTGFSLSSCVHREFEYPSPEALPVEVELELQYFDKEMPLHTIVNHDKARSGATDSPVSRHIIKVYDSLHEEVASTVLSDEATNATIPRQLSFRLAPGKYTAVCWTDYSNDGDTDWHYDTSAFPDVELRCSADDNGFLVHSGNTLWRDAFCGRRSFTVTDDGRVAFDDGVPTGNVSVEMRRPLARFLFEATDFEEFADAHALSISATGTPSDALPGYDITFRYSDYMPSVFSAQTDAPIDSRVGASFPGEPRLASSGSGAIETGSDFVFVHPLETSVKVTMEVHNTSSGNIVARAGPFTVPLLRNRLTIVRGRFFTSQSEGGIVIDPGFDGEYNIEIK